MKVVVIYLERTPNLIVDETSNWNTYCAVSIEDCNAMESPIKLSVLRAHALLVTATQHPARRLVVVKNNILCVCEDCTVLYGDNPSYFVDSVIMKKPWFEPTPKH